MAPFAPPWLRLWPETSLFSNFAWEGVDLSCHCKACDVLFVQAMCSSGCDSTPWNFEERYSFSCPLFL